MQLLQSCPARHTPLAQFEPLVLQPAAHVLASVQYCAAGQWSSLGKQSTQVPSARQNPLAHCGHGGPAPASPVAVPALPPLLVVPPVGLPALPPCAAELPPRPPLVVPIPDSPPCPALGAPPTPAFGFTTVQAALAKSPVSTATPSARNFLAIERQNSADCLGVGRLRATPLRPPSHTPMPRPRSL